MTTSRRLHFVVGTSLLGASLSLGCTPKPKPNEDLHVNPGPNDRGPQSEPDDADAGAVDEPDEPIAEPKPEADVNVGPIDEPDPEPTTKTVNTRPNN